MTKTLHLGKMLYFCYLYSIVKNQINNKHWNTINLDGTIEAELKDFFLNKLGIEIDICREKYIKPRIMELILEETLYAD